MPLVLLPRAFLVDANGVPRVGAKLYLFDAGTTTPRPSYTTPAFSTPHAHPVLSLVTGLFPAVWLNSDDGGPYKLVIRDAADDGSGTPVVSEDNLPLLPFDLDDITSLLYPRTAAEIAADVTPTNYLYPAGDARRFGLSTGASAGTNVLAIQSVLDSGYNCYIHGVGSSYNIDALIRLRYCGQKLYGDGAGDNNSTGYFVPRTTLRWTGASGGTMVSVGNPDATPPSNMSQCEIANLCFDGNTLAKIAIEAYDDDLDGGSWRNKYTNLSFRGLTGTDSTAIYTGGGSFPDFAHDTVTHGVFVYGGEYGVRGAGARHSLSNCTFQLCTVAALRGEVGSAWVTMACIFVANGRDFDGSNIQLFSDYGSWFENSVNGIYRAATAHCAQFLGSVLHTANMTRLMDMGNAAGNVIIKGFVNDTSASTLIENINDSYELDVIGTNCTTETGYRERVQGVQRGLQCAFAAGITADDSNATGDGTTRSLNAVAWTEVFDRSSSFAAGTGTFTAPVDGEYEFDVRLNLQGLAAGHTDGRLYLNVNGVQHLLWRGNIGAIRDATDEVVINGSDTAFLSAGQTVYVQVYVAGGAKTVDVGSGADGNLWRTRFQGRML